MFRDFSPELWKKLELFCTEQRKRHNERLAAAFDADGTLWDIDVGEIAFHHQISMGQLDLPADPWQHYLNLKKVEPKVAYLWLAQILKDYELEEIRAWNKEAFSEHEKKYGPLPIFPAQQKWIHKLKEIGVEIYIVTASVQWAVEEPAALYNIPKENVIGVNTKILNQKITDQQGGPITYKEGKVEALKERTKGANIIFCAGNTMGDYELLKHSQGLSMAVGAADEGKELFETEEELRDKAKLHNWLIHRF